MVNWAEHNLIKDGPMLRVDGWQDYDWLLHGYSLREAGNLDYRFGAAEDVNSIRNKIALLLPAARERWVGAQQIHSDTVYGASADDAGRGAYDYDTAVPATDAFITSADDVYVMILAADCAQILVIDPVLRYVAAIHAGRGGSSLDIAGKVIRQLEEMGSNPEELEVAIGPSIGPCCYEVGAEIIEQMAELLQADEAGQKLFKTMKDSSHLDLWSVNELLLRRQGVENIIRTDLCTACHTDYFFSHRAEKGKTGRFGAFIGLV